MSRRVHIVPHTHWDREWYLPFQDFRHRLVDVLDDLLPRMEADPSFSRFLLDGQLAVVDDYLEVRPEAADAIRRLVGNGRLSIGPWYTLPDEFLVSGETLVRNLQLGLETAGRYGGAMNVGYLPDMFGHVAQMPQILAQFGFDQAVVWRGTPSAVDRTGFRWLAPDGTSVHAEYLPEGYGNGAAVPDDAKALIGQITEFDELWGDMLGEAPILWMNGADHQPPQSWLGRVVAEANDIQDDYELVITSLAEHLAAAETDAAAQVAAGGRELPSWTGELRSGARANLLMGVTSNRVDVRRAAARAERVLERLAEPLAALILPSHDWPGTLLDVAWRHMVRNAAHDSVCACSVDEVCDAVLHRYAEATQVANGLTERALRHLGNRIRHDGPVVVNPSPRPRSGLVALAWPGETPPPGTQVVTSVPAEQVVLEGPAAMVVPGTEEVNWDPNIEAFTLETADGPVSTTLVEAERVRGALITSAVRGRLAAVDHPGNVRLRVRQRPSLGVLAHAADVPGYGWARWPGHDGAPPIPHPVRVEERALANDLVRIEVDPATGTWSLNGHSGMGRMVDGGDRGDTYNWCPPIDDTLVDTPEDVSVETLEDGPLRGRLLVQARYLWPERCESLAEGPHPGDAARRVGSVPHTVSTLLELRAGEAFVRVEVTVHNNSRDHRLRLHLPLPEPADHSRAECAFGIVERPLDAEGGPTEQALPTFPSRRFLQAGGLTVVHDGVAEYELVDREDAGSGSARELALTVLRSSGMLSQGPMATRPLPAGPLIPLEGAQLQGRVTQSYAVAIGEVDPYALADEVLVPLQVVASSTEPAPGEAVATLPPQGSLLTIEGCEVSAVVRAGAGLRVRVVNPTPEPTTVTTADRSGWLVDLRDRPLEPFDGSFELRPWGIATLALPG